MEADIGRLRSTVGNAHDADIHRRSASLADNKKSSVSRRGERPDYYQSARTDPPNAADVQHNYERLRRTFVEQGVKTDEVNDRLLMAFAKLMNEGNKNEPPRSNRISQSSRVEEEEDSMQEEGARYKQMEQEETQLLRECLYALQGLEGEQIRFWNGTMNGEGVDDGIASYPGIRVRPSAIVSTKDRDPFCQSRIGSGAIDALRICGEAGWLYKRVQDYVDCVEDSSSEGTDQEEGSRQQQGGGVVSRAFAFALANELRDYHALLANFESRLQQSPLNLMLRQLVVEMHLPTARLKTLAILTDGLSHFTGGQLLSALHQHTIHGDTRHKALVQSMVYSASQPWFDMLYKWTLTGTLSDQHNEFFIKERPDVGDENMWHDRYHIDRVNIPLGIIERDLVKPSLVVGKGINFIRWCLLDTDWNLELHDENETTNDATLSNDEEIKLRLGYCYTPATARRRACPDGYYVSPLHRTLAHAAHQVHSHILQSLHEQHHLIPHLWALKQFLFLGQGDFITALMDDLHQEFDSRDGIAGLYANSLMGIMDGALQNTNAAALPSYTLERLRVELMLDEDDKYRFGPHRSQNRGHSQDSDDDESVDLRSGWDIFMLTYDVPSPLKCIVHPSALARYKLVFSLLFRLRRVEYMLNATWRQSTALQHSMFSYSQRLGIKLNTDVRYRRTNAFLRKVSLARQSMLHFVGNLQSYLMIEVLEGGWKELVRNIKAARTLDELIRAHEKYLCQVVRKSFLHDESPGSTKKHNPRFVELAQQLNYLFEITEAFCSLQERMFNDAQEELEKATTRHREAERRTELDHAWGFEPSNEEAEVFGVLTDQSTLQKVLRVSEEFDETFDKVLSGLNETINGNGFDSPPSSPVTTPSSGVAGFDGSVSETRRGRDSVRLDEDSLRFLTFQLDYSNYYSNRATTNQVYNNLAA